MVGTVSQYPKGKKRNVRTSDRQVPKDQKLTQLKIFVCGGVTKTSTENQLMQCRGSCLMPSLNMFSFGQCDQNDQNPNHTI